MVKVSFVLLMIIYTVTVGFVGYRIGTWHNIGMCVSKCSLAVKAMNIVWPVTSKITFIIGESPCEKICALTEIKDTSIFENLKVLERFKKSNVFEKVQSLRSDVSSYLLKYMSFNKNETI